MANNEFNINKTEDNKNKRGIIYNFFKEYNKFTDKAIIFTTKLSYNN